MVLVFNIPFMKVNLCNKMDRKNKNSRCVVPGRRRLLQINYKDKFSWFGILIKITLLAGIFKDCLILLQNNEIYVFTLTSVQMFAVLQETSSRKVIPLRDIHSYCSKYGTNHTFAIFWTVKGDARVMPECVETKNLFKEMSNELSEVKNSPDMVSVPFCNLINATSGHETDVHAATVNSTTYCVNFVNGIRYEKDIFDERKQRRSRQSLENVFSLASSKKVVPRRNNFLHELRPYTGSQYYTREAEYPQQVSSEQDNGGRSEIAFSNGASFVPLERRYYSFASDSNQNRSGGEVDNRTTAGAPTVSGQAKYPAYVNYSERLRTYARWTHRKPDPTQLSESGFFFTNQGDLVRCYQCGLGLKDFCEDDDPLLEHVRHFSHCPYLSEHLGRSQVSSILNQLQQEDPELNRQRQLAESRGTRPQLNLEYRHPEYQTVESRLLSFEKWPSQMIQTPAQLAEAGLYYTGFEDHVRCFACDGGLRRWDPDDDPWTEHCRWFPACPFARQQKGDEYIALVQASAGYENKDNITSDTSRARDEELSNTMEQMTLRDPEFRAALEEHRDTCIEMGYRLEDFNEAVKELRNRGTIKPTIEELLDSIELIKERRRQAIEQEKKQNETPLEENQRLKNFVICMICGRNDVNVLFLPCAHHRLCMACAEPLVQCPVCERNIRQKIRTYMA